MGKNAVTSFAALTGADEERGSAAAHGDKPTAYRELPYSYSLRLRLIVSMQEIFIDSALYDKGHAYDLTRLALLLLNICRKRSSSGFW